MKEEREASEPSSAVVLPIAAHLTITKHAAEVFEGILLSDRLALIITMLDTNGQVFENYVPWRLHDGQHCLSASHELPFKHGC